jgi:OOP family OmpA-OmpF porin
MTAKGENKGFFSGLSDVKMNELRKMIIGLDSEDLKRLALFINDPEAFSEEISGLLPNSINHLLKSGKISYSVLVPAIESVLKESIKNDPHTLAGVLFPIMMPAIRKAVAEDIKSMMDSLNSTLENGFSPKRLGWRFKALFSGRSYTEIVLSNAYVFRVKQVFLIHKESGLLLNDTSSDDGSKTQDADMVSSMLSAIKDFVQDSFNVDKTNELDTIKVGMFNIWLEQGPHAIVAATVDGEASAALRNRMRDAIEKIHLKHSFALEKFDGDTDEFKPTDAYLESCLMSEQKEKKKHKPFAAIFLFLIIFLIAGFYAYKSIEKSMRIDSLEDSLNAEAGILITDEEKYDGKTLFSGFRDPESVNPYQIAKAFQLDSSDLVFALKPFISLDDKLVVRRAYSVLNPPETISLRFENGTLFAVGEADEEWVKMSKRKFVFVPGINYLNVKGVRILFNKSYIQRKILSIEEYYFKFKYLRVELNTEQKNKFANLIDEVKDILDFKLSQDSVPVIVVTAHTSYRGNAEANKKVAFKRAQEFINLMINVGIPMEVLVPKSSYIEDTNDKFPVRSVSFKVIYVRPEDL